MNEYVLRNEDQLSRFKSTLDNYDLPIQIKISKVKTPKSTKQVRYAHSLCAAVGVYQQVDKEDVKRDSKREYGTIIVCMSSITGGRTAKLKSFGEYSKDEMAAYLSCMQAYLDEHQIPYIKAQE